MTEATCAHCLNAFTYERPRGGRTRKYCSTDCARAANAKRQAQRDRAYQQQHGKWPRRELRAKRQCERCGQAFQGIATARYCTLQCSVTAATRLAAAANLKTTTLALYVRPAPHVRPTVTAANTTSRLTSGQCRVCGAWFVSRHADVTCSTDCWSRRQANKMRIRHDRRRALKLAAFVEVVHRHKVFARDNYRCHLCGRKTLAHQTVPNLRAPTVDHIVPLAAGGTHEPLNCRTACFGCNSRKGDRGGGEQLLLIA